MRRILPLVSSDSRRRGERSAVFAIVLLDALVGHLFDGLGNIRHSCGSSFERRKHTDGRECETLGEIVFVLLLVS
jgi:hypothetical protein